MQIFGGSPDRDEMRKRNITSLEVLAEQVRKAELQIFASQGRAEAREQNFTYLVVKAERKCGSGTSHFWQSMQNESADVELQIFGSQVRAEMRKLVVKRTNKRRWDCYVLERDRFGGGSFVVWGGKMGDQKTYFVVMQDNFNALYRRHLVTNSSLFLHIKN